MSILSNIAEAILPLTGTDGFGRELVVNGSPVVGVFSPNVAGISADLSGVMVDQYRLECASADLVVKVGRELEIDGDRWLVVAVSPGLPGLTDAVLERFS